MKRIVFLILAALLCASCMAESAAWFCPNDGSENNGNFCMECGAARPAGWTCPNCGTTGQSGNFCVECGAARPQDSSPETAYVFEGEGPGFDSPEDALTAYISALNAGDVPAMLSTFAIETYVDNMNAAEAIDRIRSISAAGYYTVPVAGPYIRGILIERRRDEISKFLYYSWLYYTTVGTDFSDLGKMSPMVINDQNTLNHYLDVMETSPVETWPGHISLTAIYTPEDIRSSIPAAYFSEQTQKNMERQRLSCGADELAERVAMLNIDGANAIQFMSCVRYGDRWYNRTPMSILAMISGTEMYSGGMVWQ